MAGEAAPYAWKQYSAAIVLRPETTTWPETITPPPDRRHRWVMTSERRDARGWPSRRRFRCRACGRRKSVTLLMSVLGEKIEQAERSLRTMLTQELYGRESFGGAAG